MEALSEFRSGFLYWIIKVSLINNFRQWSDLARMMGLLKQTGWLGLSVKCRVTSASCGVLEEGSWLLIRVIKFHDVWPIYELSNHYAPKFIESNFRAEAWADLRMLEKVMRKIEKRKLDIEF